MGFCLPGIRRASFGSNQATSKVMEVPKRLSCSLCWRKPKEAVCDPIAYLNQPSNQELLNQAEEEFGYDHPLGGMTISCREDAFSELISSLNRLI